MPKKLYEAELYKLQSELATMQHWVQETGARVLFVIEGRDASGKGGAISRLIEYMNPRYCKHIALPAPTAKEKGEWYFQRYVKHLPTAGEIVVFDRSWYNRAGVERVMGFCTDAQYDLFMRQVPIFEQLLIDDGILLRKYWFSVSDAEQQRRFESRASDPLRRWKLSPMDLESIARWEAYTKAKDQMFAVTDTSASPWWTVESDDKRAARLNFMYHVLENIPYTELPQEILSVPARPKAVHTARPPRNYNRFVPDFAQAVVDNANNSDATADG